jgi:hypothetical protein
VKEKKQTILGPIRVDDQLAKGYSKALSHYSLSRANFTRMCMTALIDSHHSGRDLELPISFMTMPTREARKAVKRMGIDLPTLREELARDIVGLAANGEKLARPGRIMTQREQDILSAI